MELVDSWEEMFQWQTPFCATPLNGVVGPEETIHSLDALPVDIELPEINLGPEQVAPASHPSPLSTSLWPLNPVSIPLSPSHRSRTIPGVTSATQAPESTRNPGLQFAVNTTPCSVQTGTRGFEIPAPTTPMSSAPKTPPVVKPKRSRGRGKAEPKCTTRKKSPQELGFDAAEPKSKKNRVPTTAGHIIRERQRRDDMSSKYSILESLLPPTPNTRERAVVVEDAISFVGALQQKKAQLLNRRADLKLMASYNQSPWSKKTRSENGKSDSPLSGSSDGVVVQADPVSVTSAGTISAIHVQVGEEKVVMEMVWNRPRPNFQSALLQAVQSLGLDVTQCSILRMGNGYIQCVVTCSKVLSQRISEIQSSSTLIIRALRNVLTKS